MSTDSYGAVDKYVTSELVDIPSHLRVDFVMALCDQWGLRLREQLVVQNALLEAGIEETD